MMLKGKKIKLRALESSDLDFLYQLENNTDIWEISGTLVPYSRRVLQDYLKNAHRDIYEVKQLRLAICDVQDSLVGLIDLFDFDPKNRRAGLGIVIANEEDRNKGYGSEAISILCDYAFKILDLRQIYANVGEENKSSIKLFKKLGFELGGIKKDWILFQGRYKNEYFFQRIKN